MSESLTIRKQEDIRRKEYRMGFLSKLLGREEADNARSVDVPPTCLHTMLLPQWDSVDDIGHEEKVTGYHCEGCGRMFTPPEARILRTSEGVRVRTAAETLSRN